ncbi:MAG TPA: DUF169 domain-containing protein [Methanocella sp.]
MSDYAALSDTLTRRLGLSHPPIAISLLPELPQGMALTPPVRLCEMWAKALEGETVFATAKEESCGGGAFYLGLAEAAPELKNGVLLSRLYPVHRTPMAAVRTTMLASPRIPSGTGAAVVCAPLGRADFDVDVVLIVCTPAQAMVFADAVSYETGGFLSGMTGPATCSVAVAGPYLSGKPTFCVADSGAREYMKLGDDEMIVSLPGDMLVPIVRNLEEMAQH